MGRLPLFLHRIAHFLFRLRVPVLPKLIAFLNRLIFSCYIGPGAQIGKGVSLGYAGLGVVIHGDAEIGCNVRIGSGVTIGGRSKIREVPKIEDDVFIGAGAKILGPVRVKAKSVVGANAVVVRDVETGTVVAGIPARVIKTGITIADYHAAYD